MTPIAAKVICSLVGRSQFQLWASTHFKTKLNFVRVFSYGAIFPGDTNEPVHFISAIDTKAMADPPDPLTTSQEQKTVLEARQTNTNRRIMYYSALGACVACPAVALMPPRKYDLFTFGLGIAFFISAGHVVEERTGQGLLWHVGNALPSVQKKDRIKEVQDQEQRLASSIHTKQARGFWRKLWMGNEGDDWVLERAKKEREALEDGRGYSGLIGEHIMQAFGYSEPRPENEDD